MGWYSITAFDSSGAPQLDLDVDLYTGDGGSSSSKEGDFSNLGNGTYKIEVTTSGLYTVKINGITQSEQQNFPINAYEDTLHVGDIVDDLTTGGTDVPLSAEQGKELYENKLEISDIYNGLTSTSTVKALSAAQGKALNDGKENSANIGNRAYTDHNVVTDSETITASIDALDKVLGSPNMSSNKLLSEYYNNCIQAGTVPTIGGFINILTQQIYANLQAITQGTEIYNRRVIYADCRAAAITAGSAAAAVFEYTETSTSLIVKFRPTFRKQTGDKYLKIKFDGKVSGGATAYLEVWTADGDKSITWTDSSYTEQSLILDISKFNEELYVGYIGVKISSGSGTLTLRYINISVEGA